MAFPLPPTRVLLRLPQVVYLFRYGVTPSRNIAIVFEDTDGTPVVLAQVTY